LLYKWKVSFLKTHRGNRLYWRWRRRKGDDIGNYARLPEYIRSYAPGKSFADIGCMWGVNGEYSFLAEEAGATLVKGVDVFGPTPEFEEKKRGRSSSVEFVLGDITRRATLERVGVVDVVLCAGVLYHHPSPFDVLAALRQICGRTLILRTAAIPEVNGLPNAAVFYPMLPEQHRKLWNQERLGTSGQMAIANPYRAEDGHGNWFWGLTPSCIKSMLETAGFRVEHRATEAWAQTFICSPVATAFVHQLPDEPQARQMGADVSAAGLAKPA
jgi:SAM-dependent methyltransferase